MLSNSAVAQRAIKLATVVPDGSIWDKNLKQMAEEWKQATSGRVTVTVFGGATFGGSPFTSSTLVNFGASQLSPATVSGDGRSLTFSTPAGTAGSCVSVSVENPGLPFSLPDFCYSG